MPIEKRRRGSVESDEYEHKDKIYTQTEKSNSTGTLRFFLQELKDSNSKYQIRTILSKLIARPNFAKYKTYVIKQILKSFSGI